MMPLATTSNYNHATDPTASMKPERLLPTLRAALDDDVSVINCPVDYRENLRLIERLGQLDTAL